MKLDKDTYDRIMNYLNGEMTTNEKDNFESDCQNDIKLNEVVSIMKTMNIVYGSEDWFTLEQDTDKIKEARLLFDNDDVKQFSKQVRLSQEYYKTKTHNSTNKVLKYIASIAAVGLLALVLNNYLNTSLETEEAFNLYYTHQDLPSFTVQNSAVSQVIKAEQLFKDGKFAEALDKFNVIDKDSDTMYPNKILYTAMCHLELKNYELSLTQLEHLEQSNTIDFHKAYWFKALVYLKLNEKDKAISTLKIITEHSNFFNHEKAIKLLKML